MFLVVAEISIWISSSKIKGPSRDTPVELLLVFSKGKPMKSPLGCPVVLRHPKNQISPHFKVTKTGDSHESLAFFVVTPGICCHLHRGCEECPFWRGLSPIGP